MTSVATGRRLRYPLLSAVHRGVAVATSPESFLAGACDAIVRAGGLGHASVVRHDARRGDQTVARSGAPSATHPVALALEVDGRAWGRLTLDVGPAPLEDDERGLLAQLADDLGFAVAALTRAAVRRSADRAERHRREEALHASEARCRAAAEEHEALNRRYARHERALSSLTRASAIHPERIGEVFAEVTEIVAGTLEVARVSIWRYGDDETSIVCEEMFDAAQSAHRAGAILHRADIPAYFAALALSDRIVVHDARRDPRTAELRDAYLVPHDISSMLDIPLFVRGRVVGVLCSEHVGPARTWTSDEQTFAVAVANLVSMLLAHVEQQQLEAQLRESQKLEAIGTLAGGVAHDFNNILSAIVTFTDLVREERPADAALQDDLGEVLAACDRARVLVRQILSFSRKQPRHRTTLPLDVVVHDALRLMRSTLPRSIDLVAPIGDEALLVVADPTEIHQIVMNLCSNAAHAIGGRPGRLTVGLRARRLDDGVARPGSFVCLTVTDDGTGMDEATRRRIFEPFFTTKGTDGTGLGLAVVHGIVRELGGVIQVASELGRGTTFDVYLPVASASAAGLATGARLRARGGGQRVLVVDDEPAICAGSRRLLEHHGFRAETFADPLAACRAFEARADEFDLVLTDLTMPGMTGVELVERVRRLRPDVPILMASGFHRLLPPERASELGVELLAKPVEPGALVEAIVAATRRGGPAS